MATLEELFALAAQIANLSTTVDVGQWDAGVRHADASVLVALLGRLSVMNRFGEHEIRSSPVPIERAAALRDQVRAEIERRLSEEQITAAERLAESTDALNTRILVATWAGSIFGLVAAVIAVVALARAW